MALSDLTAPAVNQAIAEFDEIGRAVFLKKYGFGQARTYFLEINDRRYDSKAIAGAAHGFLPDRPPLSATRFSGGDASVKRVLERLGFTVTGPKASPFDLPPIGTVFVNSGLASSFQVGVMGGMRRSKALNLLLLVSDPFKGLYQDRWEGKTLHYTGMGPSGDQSLSYAQNQTLAESLASGISVHLVEVHEPLKYTYAGEVELIANPYQEEQVGKDGQPRQVWMFPLTLKGGALPPAITAEQILKIEDAQRLAAHKLSLDALRKRAAKAKKQPAMRAAQTTAFVRDPAVAELARRLADGKCDLCENAAPFKRKDNEPYLEAHHVVWLAKGGPDTIDNTAALCPNCHRKMHVRNLPADRAKLTSRLAKRSAED